MTQLATAVSINSPVFYTIHYNAMGTRVSILGVPLFMRLQEKKLIAFKKQQWAMSNEQIDHSQDN